MCFTFPSRPNVKILNNVNLSIESNTVTAIVGRSGSGKSTIASLLLRFYDPQSGGVYLDGVDIKELNLKWLRKHIAAVSQEPVLFSGTIRYNILYGLNSEEDENLANEHFNRVVEQSYVDDFVKTLPDGYDTVCVIKLFSFSCACCSMFRVLFFSFNLPLGHWSARIDFKWRPAAKSGDSEGFNSSKYLTQAF